MVNFPIFDRYVLPALPVVGILYARAATRVPATTLATGLATEPIEGINTSARPGTGGGRRMGGRRLGAGVAMSTALLIALGFVYTDESASYDGARWRVAVEVTQQDFAVSDIDAGYEWVGFRLDRSPPFRLIGKPEAYRKAIKNRYLKGLCITVVVSDRERPETTIAEAVSNGLLRDPVTLYAKQLPDTKCASGHPSVDGDGEVAEP